MVCGAAGERLREPAAAAGEHPSGLALYGEVSAEPRLPAVDPERYVLLPRPRTHPPRPVGLHAGRHGGHSNLRQGPSLLLLRPPLALPHQAGMDDAAPLLLGPCFDRRFLAPWTVRPLASVYSIRAP